MTTAGVNKISGNLASAMLNFSGLSSAATQGAQTNGAAKFSGLNNQPAKDTFSKTQAGPAQTGVAAYPSASSLLGNATKAAAANVAFSGNKTANKPDASGTGFASRFLGANYSASGTGLSADQRISGEKGDKQFN